MNGLKERVQKLNIYWNIFLSECVRYLGLKDLNIKSIDSISKGREISYFGTFLFKILSLAK